MVWCGETRILDSRQPSALKIAKTVALRVFEQNGNRQHKPLRVP